MEDFWRFLIVLDALAPFALFGFIAYILAKKYMAKRKIEVK
ncbi:hypothetical protein [Burkholderia contaminans]|nr:hypothetical protein [Burkholderia contaminans]